MWVGGVNWGSSTEVWFRKSLGDKTGIPFVNTARTWCQLGDVFVYKGGLPFQGTVRPYPPHFGEGKSSTQVGAGWDEDM